MHFAVLDIDKLCAASGVQLTVPGLVMAKRVDPGLLITHQLRSLEGIEPAFQMVVDKPDDLIKPVVMFE